MFWMTINEYSGIKNISISTIRRYIKSDKVVWKKEDDGKYYIKVDSLSSGSALTSQNDARLRLLEERNAELQRENRKLLHENNEMKMLINLYEKSIQDTNEEFINI